jgi:hypothetical protein
LKELPTGRTSKILASGGVPKTCFRKHQKTLDFLPRHFRGHFWVKTDLRAERAEKPPNPQKPENDPKKTPLVRGSSSFTPRNVLIKNPPPPLTLKFLGFWGFGFFSWFFENGCFGSPGLGDRSGVGWSWLGGRVGSMEDLGMVITISSTPKTRPPKIGGTPKKRGPNPKTPKKGQKPPNVSKIPFLRRKVWGTGAFMPFRHKWAHPPPPPPQKPCKRQIS